MIKNPTSVKKPGGTGVLTCAFLSPLIKPGVIFRAGRQPSLHRVIPDIVPLFQKLRLIPDDAVIALILPDGAIGSPALVNLIDAKSFNAVDNLGKTVNSALRVRLGLRQNVYMVGHNNCGVYFPFVTIMVKQASRYQTTF
jgi:hypothetical protein